MKHTLGKWEVRQSPSRDLIVQQHDSRRLFPPMICTVSRWLDDDEAIKQEAQCNAKLIAAAPEMEDALATVPLPGPIADEAWRLEFVQWWNSKGRLALAKATEPDDQWNKD